MRWAIPEPTSLLPMSAVTPADLLLADALFDGLTRWDDELRPVPDVARRWARSADARTWTFHLSQAATFADGTPVTAQVFGDAWSTMARRGAAHHHLRNVEGYDDVRSGAARALRGVTAVDDSTLRVRLRTPDADFAGVVGHPALAPTLPRADATAAARDEPVGNGAFRMAEPWAHGEFVRLTRRGVPPAGTGSATPVHEVVFQVGDSASGYIAYEQGGVDVAAVPPGALRAEPPPAERRSRYRGPGLLTGELPSLYLLGFNLTEPPFDDIRARRGVSLALDRRGLIDDAFEGNASPGWSVVPPLLPEGRRRSCPYCRHDPEEATRLLSAAGVRAVTLWINTGGDHELVARAIRRDLAGAGVSVKIRAVPFAEFQRALRRGEPGLYRFGWTLDYPSAANILQPLFHSASDPQAGGANIFRYADSRVDRLLDRAPRAPAAQRQSLYRAAEDLVLRRDQAVVPLAGLRHRTVVSDRVRGLTYGPFGTADLTAVRLLDRVDS